MSGWQLTLIHAGPLRLDLRALTPTAVAALDQAALERLPIGLGHALVPLGECFRVAPLAADTLVLSGNLQHGDRIGWCMAGGQLRVEGPVGHHAGAGMTGGRLQVDGDAGLLTGCQMAGGELEVQGSVGDFAASALPGSMDGMRGGTLVVRGNAGERLGDRMRRGTVVVFGDAGDYLASRMVAGTIALAGRCGAHAAWGMRRGSIVLCSAQPAPSAGFVATQADASVFWQLLARSLVRHGGPFAGLPARRIERRLGDVAADGKGELIFPQ